MQKSSLPVGLKTLIKYYEKDGTLSLESPIQRRSGQWNNLKQSMLIHSMLSDYIIPHMYFRKEQKDGRNFLTVLDGKQRLTTCMSFINDEWTTHAKTPDAVLDGVHYDLALKKFSELEEDVKQAILAYRFTIYQLEDCTDEEIEETFARINSGVALSRIQSARPVLGMELAEFFNGLGGHPFFQEAINLTLAQFRREDDFLMLMTIAMLLEDLYYGDFQIKTSASAAECVRFAEVIRGDYSVEKREMMEGVVGYLDEAFGGSEKKFLRKTNIPIVGYVAALAMGRGIAEMDYASAVTGFFTVDETEAYKEASGSGNVKMVNVKIRIAELLSCLISCFPDKFGSSDRELVERFNPAVKEERMGTEEKSEGIEVLGEENGTVSGSEPVKDMESLEEENKIVSGSEPVKEDMELLEEESEDMESLEEEKEIVSGFEPMEEDMEPLEEGSDAESMETVEKPEGIPSSDEDSAGYPEIQEEMDGKG